MNRVIIVLLALLICIVGCDLPWEDDDDDKGTKPKISGLYLYDNTTRIESYAFDQGDLVYFEVYANDPDLDMETMFASYYYYNTDNVYSGPEATNLPSQVDEAMMYYPLEPIVVDLPLGTFTVVVQIEDAEGNKSNKFRRNILVQ